MYPGKLLAIILALSSALSLAGCSGSADPNQHNNVDVAFAQQMIPHHRQAVQMSALAPQRAGTPPVTQLASAIEAAQQPEIDQMVGMLQSWHEAIPPQKPAGTSDMPGMSGMDHGAMLDMPSMERQSMPGMMSGMDMAALGRLTGAAFDRQFLTMMISHHQGALDMAATELRAGVNPGAKALAQRITDSQTAQINQMRGMLAAG